MLPLEDEVATVVGTDATAEEPSTALEPDEETGRRRKAQYRPSNVGRISTTSQPSLDFFVNSLAIASGLALYGLNATYSNMQSD